MSPSPDPSATMPSFVKSGCWTQALLFSREALSHFPSPTVFLFLIVNILWKHHYLERKFSCFGNVHDSSPESIPVPSWSKGVLRSTQLRYRCGWREQRESHLLSQRNFLKRVGFFICPTHCLFRWYTHKHIHVAYMLHMFMCVHVCARLCMYMWKPEVNIGYLFYWSPLYILR